METLLLLIDSPHHHRLVAKWLRERYSLCEPRQDALASLPPFDLCITDEASLNCTEALLARRKIEAGEILLPVLLLAGPRSLNPDAVLSPLVDEIITTPLLRTELLVRVDALLRTRRLSLEIRQGSNLAHQRARQSPCDSVELQKAMMEDITTRKRVDEALRESEERFHRLVEDAPDCIVIQTRGKFSYLNKAAIRLMGGHSVQQFLGTSILDRFPQESRETVARLIRQINETGQPIPALRLTGLRVDGTPVEIEISAVPFQFKGQDGALAFVRDLSERVRAEEERRHLLEQLYQAQKLESVGRLAGGVAHDFNNLLSVILGYGEVILEETGPEHPHHEPLTQLVQAGLRARNLTRQLLAFSRKQILELRPLDLNEVVTGFAKLLRRVIGEDLTMDQELAVPPLPIMGDTAQLEQVLMNLAVNARDAMPEGGRLTIATAAVDLDQAFAESRPGVSPGPYAMLEVRDTGCGMSPEIAARVFEPFFTTKDKDKGTGLGLATTYGIIKQHGGNIWVDSEPGQGATFRIYLPLTAAVSADAAPAARAPELPPSPATVLVVEDDPSLKQMVVRVLTRKGYSVIDSKDVHDAMERAATLDAPLHLVLADVVMPGMLGTEVVDRIHAHHPKARVLYMSGYADHIIARHGVLMEGIQFIQKPFTVDGLLAKIHDVLNR